ncbi:MAG: methyl-accepting chemotaxis protein [Magnetococcales bacterium]|nr:methyl-accepting chemotaxis protein [Magnetococcales bacterium]
MFKNMKLATHLMLLLLVVEAGALAGGGNALRVVQHLENRIASLDGRDFPLNLAVADAARQQMDQVLRFSEVLLYAQVDDRQNFEIANDGFIHAGKRLANVLIEARHITQKALDTPGSDEERNHLERIKGVMGDLEKIHGGYEHLAGTIIRGQFKYRFLTKAGLITGTATQSQGEAEREYREELNKTISSLDDETKRLENKLKEAYHLTKELLRNLSEQAGQERKMAWILFLLCSGVALVAGVALLLAVNRIHGLRFRDLQNAIRQRALPFGEKAESLRKTAQRLDHSLSHQAESSRQLAETMQHALSGLANLEGLAATAVRATVEIQAVMEGNAHGLTDADRALREFGEAARRSMEEGEHINKSVAQLGGHVMRLNLLATSASVEATRAEGKRGFAIFTDEIKEISQKTQGWIDEIGERSAGLLKDLAASRSAMERAGGTLREIAAAATRLQGVAGEKLQASRQLGGLVESVHSDTSGLHELFAAYSRLLLDNAGACRQFREQTEAIEALLQEIGALMEDRRTQTERRSGPPMEPSLPVPRAPFTGGDLKVEDGVLKLEKKG